MGGMLEATRGLGQGGWAMKELKMAMVVALAGNGREGASAFPPKSRWAFRLQASHHVLHLSPPPQPSSSPALLPKPVALPLARRSHRLGAVAILLLHPLGVHKAGDRRQPGDAFALAVGNSFTPCSKRASFSFRPVDDAIENGMRGEAPGSGRGRRMLCFGAI